MSQEVKDEALPSWLDEALLERALKNSFKNEDLKILDSEKKKATAIAENYASRLFRFGFLITTKKDGSPEPFSVIVKLFALGRIGEAVDRIQGYEKERIAFAEVLPDIHDLLQKAYPDHKKLWPECYHHDKSPHFILILEDLQNRGFFLARRTEGLDLEHSILVMKSLGKFHAASLVWRNKNLQQCQLFKRNYCSPENAGFINTTLLTSFKVLSKDILEWPKFDKRDIYSEKLKNIANNGVQKLTDLWRLDETKINLFLHGDLWGNNILFKYDPKGKVQEVNFVDFQLSSINHPVMDLHHFIFSSVNSSIKFDQVDLLLRTYYEAFVEAQKRLGHGRDKSFSFEQLKKDFENKYLWGLVMFCAIYPVFVIPPAKAFTAEDILKGEAEGMFGSAYRRKSLRGDLMRGFKHFEEKGVL